MEPTENLYRIGYEALAFGDACTQRDALQYAQNMYPTGKCMDIRELTLDCIPDNLRAYCQALWNEMHIGRPHVNFIAVERLRQNIGRFSNNTILYRQDNGVLTAADLLKLVQHTLSCIQLITGIDTGRIRQAITALKGLKLLLSNEYGELGEIGYAVEVFGAISEQMTTNPAIKQNILGLETILVLTINFFTDTKIGRQ